MLGPARTRAVGGFLPIGEYALQNRDVQILLAAEEVVGCAPRQPSRVADLLKAHRFKAAFGKQRLSGVQDRPAAAVRVADPRSGG